MSSNNQNRSCVAKLRSFRTKPKDFSRVGGLNQHILLLRDLIIVPMLYADVYSFFHVSAPRGVLFHGPPGTGKTLVAGALAAELNKEGYGKVNFHYRKGADILDKWVGEAERKLRELFEKASRNRPSIIFFDELDGLAPARSQKDEHIHCSIVTTLLSLMDGLDNIPGVIIIGATNRVDTIDPALRRPGRFDRELYFPLPCTSARKEILQVHMQGFNQKPSPEFLMHLAEITSGCNGSDLQALCSEALLCCLKRHYPNIHQQNLTNKIPIDVNKIKLEECDFISARLNITPSTERLLSKMRKLCPFIKPLLQRQLDNIMLQLQVLWPHFINPSYKFLAGQDRYVGRLLLIGNREQGLNMHIVPAILQALEHLPIQVVDVPGLFEETMKTIQRVLPSVLVFARINDFWDLVSESSRATLSITLEELHAGMPVLIIATCDDVLPEPLHSYFHNYSSLVINMENPTTQEREEFFTPLFFSSRCLSIIKVADNLQKMKNEPVIKSPRKYEPKLKIGAKRKMEGDHAVVALKRLRSHSVVDDWKSVEKRAIKGKNKMVEVNNAVNTNDCNENKRSKNKGVNAVAKLPKYRSAYTTTITNLINRSKLIHCLEGWQSNISNPFERNSLDVFSPLKRIKQEPTDGYKSKTAYLTRLHGDNLMSGPDKIVVDTLWNRLINTTSENLTVGQLELLYDTIKACIYINCHDFKSLTESMTVTLAEFEQTKLNV